MDESHIARREFFYVGGAYAGAPGEPLMHGQIKTPAARIRIQNQIARGSHGRWGRGALSSRSRLWERIMIRRRRRQ
jgi:hypothetical protein